VVAEATFEVIHRVAQSVSAKAFRKTPGVQPGRAMRSELFVGDKDDMFLDRVYRYMFCVHDREVLDFGGCISLFYCISLALNDSRLDLNLGDLLEGFEQI
jgi:hypothetical protein